jgi:hypothetical protein
MPLARELLSACEGLCIVSHILLALGQTDQLCAQFAAALQHSELQIYATLGLLLLVGVLLFPPRNDPDQI